MVQRRLFSRSILTTLGVVLGGGIAVTGCLGGRVCPGEPGNSAMFATRLASSSVDKVDLLLAIDNSASMADKQALLALAVPDLVRGLVNPPCLGADGQPVLPGPNGPLDVCPKGSERPFQPVLDIHVGIVTSSLGSRGADTCIPTAERPSNDDRGHLISRADPQGASQVPTYQAQGFLAWDPAQKLDPPGEADLDADSAADPNKEALSPVLQDMIVGVGQEGCGFESQLESWYRFLVDPSPYATIEIDDQGRVVPTGVDQALLAERKAFLRPDSLLAIVMLTDENDCSVRDTGQYYFSLRMKTESGKPFHLPRPRSECATNPDDPCCFSCGQKGPKNDDGSDLCPSDPTCTDENGGVAQLTQEEDPLSLRCWDQKRRFGIDFLQPLDRYARALYAKTVVDRSGQEVQNPLFSDLDPNDANFETRTENMVILTGIVGVPWQDLARDPKDLSKGFMTAEELSQKDATTGLTRWDVVIGDPSTRVPPVDPLMIEATTPRSGKNPITGDALVTSDTPLANPINGHERKDVADQLQYACLFDLPKPLDCGAQGNCGDPDDSPVFDPPYDAPALTQPRAGAVPGTRVLDLLKRAGNQGVAASVCPAQTVNDQALDFGYRPAISAALTRLQASLTRACLPRVLTPDDEGQVNCVIIEAAPKITNGACCDPANARRDVPEEKKGALAAVQDDLTKRGASYDCFCEIPQLEGSAEGEPLHTCQNDTARNPTLPDGTEVSGYCYVDQTSIPPLGNPDLVASCPSTEKRSLRFVGKGNAANGATLYIVCGDGIDPGYDSAAPAKCE